MHPQCLVYRLGLVPYRTAWQLQDDLAARIACASHPPALLLLQHPHVFTFGRRGRAGNLLWDEAELERRGVEVVWADRGGDVTYHGPGQLVGYPLLPLAPGGLYTGITPSAPPLSSRAHPKGDYIGYLRKLEQVLIDALAHFNVRAMRLEGKTGVWLPPDTTTGRGAPAKIAAIGVKVDARGVSRHGFALNIDPDMSYWEGIIACGLAGHPAASLAEILHPLPPNEAVEQAVIDAFARLFGYEMAIEPNETLLSGEDTK